MNHIHDLRLVKLLYGADNYFLSEDHSYRENLKPHDWRFKRVLSFEKYKELNELADFFDQLLMRLPYAGVMHVNISDNPVDGSLMFVVYSVR